MLFIELSSPPLNDLLPPLQSENPEIPAVYDSVIQKATAKKSEERYANTLELLADLEKGWQTAVSITSPKSSPSTPISTEMLKRLENPYRGLRPFTEADADNFFGRKALVQELLGMMSDGTDLSRFLAVVGPSGSGKSSVVKAGLIPALRRGALPDSDQWFVVDLTPGTHPWEEVETALLRIAVNPPETLLTQLKENERGLHRAIRRIMPDDGQTELVLVIDQFEELFTLVDDESVRMEFLESLVTAVLDPRSRMRLVLTLRADFTDKPLQYFDFGELMRQRTVFVLPLAPTELTDAIQKPVDQLDMEMEPALVSTMVREVGDQPGMLPLLQYALTELFEQRESNLLTLESYQNSGGVLGSLAKRADEIFTNLSADEQANAQQLFLRLVTLGEGVEDTRRRVLLTELNDLQTQRITETRRVLEKVLAEYGRYRLLTFDHDPHTRGATVEVAHEALIREWPRLRSWVSESREDVRRQRLLADAAHQWRMAEQDDSYLLRGSRLIEFESWQVDTAVALTETEQNFLNQSISARDMRHQQEEARRQRELETAQKLADEQKQRAEEQTSAANSLRQRALFLMSALIVAAFLAIVALFLSRQATQNETIALEKEATAVAAEGTSVAGQATAQTSAFESEQAYGQVLAVQAQQALADGDNELAILLALAANEIPNPPESIQNILLDAAYAPGTRLLYQGHDDSVSSVAISENGQTMVSGSSDNSLIIWDIDTGEPLRRLVGHDDWVNDVAISPANQTAVSASSDGTIIWWDLETGAIKRRMAGYRLGAWSVAFHPNNEQIISGGSRFRFISEDGSREQRGDDKLLLWDLASGELLSEFGGGVDGHQGDIWSIAISPDGKSVLAGSDETPENATTLIYWDIEKEEAIFQFDSMKRAVYDVAISPDGRTGLAASADGSVTLWDLETGEQTINLPGPDDFLSGWALSVSFSPNGRSALATYGNGQIIWWNLETGQQIQQYLGHGNQVRDIVFLPDGTHAISAGHEGDLRLWDLDNQWIVANFGGASWQHQAPVSAIAISMDGRRALSGAGQGGPEWPEGGDNDLILWDLDRGVPAYRLEGHTADVTDITFGRDNLSAFSSSLDHSIIRWDLVNGEVAERINTGGRLLDVVNSVDISPDSGFAVITRDDPLGVLWNLNSGQPVRNFLGHTGQLSDMVFLAEDTKALSASHDGTLILWDVATGRALNTFIGTADLPGHAGNVIYRIAVSPNERTALSAGWDHVVILWDLETGQPIYRFLGHQGSVTGVAFLPDGQTAVSTSADGTLIAWNLKTGELLKRYASSRRDSVGLSSLAVSPNGQTILTGDFMGQISQWWLEPPQISELQEWISDNRITRLPTCQEREIYRLLPLCVAEVEATPVIGVHIPMVLPTPAVTPLAIISTETPQERSQLNAISGENLGVFSANKRDVWNYGGVSGEKISITFLPAREGIDANLQLVSQAGQLLIAEFDAPIVDFVLPEDGVYRIEVSSGLANARDSYTLIIESTRP